MRPALHPLSADLDHILAHTERAWETLRGARFFITGGTGFFGTWLLESLLWADRQLDLGASALVLTRDPEAFTRQQPSLARHPSLAFWTGDIRDFAFPEGQFSHIIHAATTSAVATYHLEDPLVKFDTVTLGTRRALEFAARCGARRFLLTSSGSVYGRQPPGITHLSEDHSGAPDPCLPESALGEGKRVAELLCADFARKHAFEITIARCFSFVGPHLQMDIHYAIGNFIRDALRGGPIRVNSDGSAVRSYLYAADLTAWLWTLLCHSENGGVYNVGSEREIRIGDLARLVAQVAGIPGAVSFASLPDPAQPLPNRYVPSTRRAQERLGLREWISLESAVEKTLAFQRHS